MHVQEEEQAALDDEAERRRKRVQAWQEQKAKALVAEEAAALKAANKAKGWSLEDDLDEVRHQPLMTLCCRHVDRAHAKLQADAWLSTPGMSAAMSLICHRPGLIISRALWLIPAVHVDRIATCAHSWK